MYIYAGKITITSDNKVRSRFEREREREIAEIAVLLHHSLYYLINKFTRIQCQYKCHETLAAFNILGMKNKWML